MRVTFLTIRGLCKNAQRVLRHIRKNERSGKVSEEIFDMSGLNEPVIRPIPLIEGGSVRRFKKSLWVTGLHLYLGIIFDDSKYQ